MASPAAKPQIGTRATEGTFADPNVARSIGVVVLALVATGGAGRSVTMLDPARLAGNRLTVAIALLGSFLVLVAPLLFSSGGSSSTVQRQPASLGRPPGWLMLFCVLAMVGAGAGWVTLLTEPSQLERPATLLGVQIVATLLVLYGVSLIRSRRAIARVYWPLLLAVNVVMLLQWALFYDVPISDATVVGIREVLSARDAFRSRLASGAAMSVCWLIYWYFSSGVRSWFSPTPVATPSRSSARTRPVRNSPP